MATQLVSAARGLVDAFNAANWERCKAILAEDFVYDEVGTSRYLTGHDEIIPALQGWREGMPDVKGTIDSAIATGTPSCSRSRGGERTRVRSPGRVAPSPQRISTRPPGPGGSWTSTAVASSEAATASTCCHSWNSSACCPVNAATRGARDHRDAGAARAERRSVRKPPLDCGRLERQHVCRRDTRWQAYPEVYADQPDNEQLTI